MKICEYCYEPLVKKPKETPGMFAGRRYCCREHASKHRGEKKLMKRPPTYAKNITKYIKSIKEGKPCSSI